MVVPLRIRGGDAAYLDDGLRAAVFQVVPIDGEGTCLLYTSVTRLKQLPAILLESSQPGWAQSPAGDDAWVIGCTLANTACLLYTSRCV